MPDRRQLLVSAAVLAATTALGVSGTARSGISITLISHYQVIRFIDDDSVEMLNGKVHQLMKRGDTFLGATLMEIVNGDFVVLEDFTAIDGMMLIVDTSGVRYKLGKTAEATTGGADFLGHSASDVVAGTDDVLAREILAKPGDPTYDEVKNFLPPISHTADSVWNFIGAPGGARIVFDSDGNCPGFDAATIQPSVAGARAKGQMLTGLLGGYLPCLRFVYPEGDGVWTETLAYVPFAGGPAQFRVARVEGGKLVSVRAIGAGGQDGAASLSFHAGVVALKSGWDNVLAPGMKVDAPDTRLADMARHSLVQTMISGETETKVLAALAAWGLATGRADVDPNTGSTLLGLPVDGSGHLAGDQLAGQAYTAVASDDMRRALLMTWAGAAHLTTRGGWMAVAGRAPLDSEAMPYSAATQAAIPLLLRWLLAFEDPHSEILWLGRGMPQAWLGETQLVFIDDIATRWGRVSFATDSRIDKEHRIAAKIVFPASGIAAATKFRLRTGQPIRRVTVNDRSWKDFDPASGDITLPAGMGGTVLLDIHY